MRQHEQAHLAAAGHLAKGGARYEYEKGPDGRQYASGGDVSISFGGRTPEERLRNAEQAERAALAPAEPSPQDRKVASEARRAAGEARREIQEEQQAETGAPDGMSGEPRPSGPGSSAGASAEEISAGENAGSGGSSSEKPRTTTEPHEIAPSPAPVSKATPSPHRQATIAQAYALAPGSMPRPQQTDTNGFSPHSEPFSGSKTDPSGNSSQSGMGIQRQPASQPSPIRENNPSQPPAPTEDRSPTPTLTNASPEASPIQKQHRLESLDGIHGRLNLTA